eukprot:GHVP01040172.1.p1 GENE.GHVP01040172.1~~GHVP01040172.1.p1  ORF type:complete len:302 (+),score=55.44 GHVP01040172.1:40-906(+)
MKKNIIAFIFTILSKANAIDFATGEYEGQNGAPPDVASNACSELNLEWVGGNGRVGHIFDDPAYAVLQGGTSGNPEDHAECGFMYQFITQDGKTYYFVVASYSDNEDSKIYLNLHQCHYAPESDNCVTPVEIELLPRVSGTYTLDADGQPEDVSVCEDYENIDWTEVKDGDHWTNPKYAVGKEAADCGKIIETHSQKNEELVKKYFAIVGYREIDERSYLLSNSDCDSCDLSSLIFARVSGFELPTDEPDGTTEGPEIPTTTTEDSGVTTADISFWIAGILVGGLFVP